MTFSVFSKQWDKFVSDIENNILTSKQDETLEKEKSFDGLDKALPEMLYLILPES